MASKEKVVIYLVNNPGWLSANWLATKDTLKLFVVVLTCESQRQDLARAEKELVAFFLRFLRESEEERLSVTCTLIRRLPIAPSFVEKLSASGFIDEYFQAVRNSSVLPYGLILLKVLANVTFTNEMVGLADLCVQVAQTQEGAIVAAAIDAAATLAKHERCLAQLKKSRMKSILGRQQKISRAGSALLAALSGY
jgi:hypothetical protein